MVPIAKLSASRAQQPSPSSRFFAAQHSPVNSPVHNVVGGDEWRYDVEDLCAGSSPRVEDGCVGCAGEGVLSVGGEAVGDDALLGLNRGACLRIMPSVRRSCFQSLRNVIRRASCRPMTASAPWFARVARWSVVGIAHSVGSATHQVHPNHRCTCRKSISTVPGDLSSYSESTSGGRGSPKSREKSRASHLDPMTCRQLTCCACREGHRRRRREGSE